MTMVCDRCGESFLLSNDVKYPVWKPIKEV